MSLLVDLQLTPQRILERVRAAVLQNREALRHGGVRSRVKQATNQRPQFTKVGATMRDYKAPVPIASSRREKEQNLAWAYVMARYNTSSEIELYEGGLKHSVYSADGTARFDNADEELFTEWTKDEGWEVIGPIETEYGPSLPVGILTRSERKPVYYFWALPAGRDQVVIQYSVQQSVTKTELYALAIDGEPNFQFGTRAKSRVFSISSTKHWAFLAGSSFVKQITPSSTLKQAHGDEYQPGIYSWESPQIGWTGPVPGLDDYLSQTRQNFLRSPLTPLLSYGSYGSYDGSYGSAYGDLIATPGLYEAFTNKDKLNDDYVEDQESDDFKRLYSYEYLDDFVPFWATKLKLVHLFYGSDWKTAFKWPAMKPIYAVDGFNNEEDRLLEGDNLSIWQPTRTLLPPDFPNIPSTVYNDFLNDIASGSSSEPPAVSGFISMALDWGRPAYCRQQLIGVLGFTEEDLTPPTP